VTSSRTAPTRRTGTQPALILPGLRFQRGQIDPHERLARGVVLVLLSLSVAVNVGLSVALLLLP
jgi:hypothetical protein